MRAREYFNKYVDRVKAETLEGSRKVVDDIFKDFDVEFSLKFKVTYDIENDDKIWRALVEELNNKWNTLRAIFMKELKYTIMEKDEFLNRYKKEFPLYFEN